MAQKIKKGDNVQILVGKDKGKRGEVSLVLPKKGKVKVQGLNLVKRHVKPSQTSAGGIEAREAALDVSNVALLDPKDDKPTRVGFALKDGQKLRVSKRSGAVVE
ncbi:MAG: 50S ribosomal protein L24 [Alphaproteobacteria bacterium]|nr:50S ribosomal protein L24 [Alphaproteobacteria bacterium]